MTKPNCALIRILWVAVIFLAFIGLAVATRRTIVLLTPGTPSVSARKNPAADLDAHFASHRALTLAHVVPAMLFMVLGPLQFVRGLRSKHPQVHRWSGRVFLSASAVVGVTGLTMAFGKTIGGVDEKAAITLFGSFFLIALGKALWHALRREFAQHREWMIRGYAIGLAVATIRPIMGTFFAAAVMRGHTPEPKEFFGTAFWIGFTLQTIAAEIWINYTRGSSRSRNADDDGESGIREYIGDPSEERFLSAQADRSLAREREEKVGPALIGMTNCRRRVIPNGSGANRGRRKRKRRSGVVSIGVRSSQRERPDDDRVG